MYKYLSKTIKRVLNWFVGFSQQAPAKQPQDLVITYTSGPSLGCRSYEVRALFDGHLIGESHGHYFPGVECRVTKIQVYDEHQRKGYGRKICGRIAEEARAAGCSMLIFEGVDLQNEPAVRLYQMLGCIAGKSKSYPSRVDFSMLL